MRKLALLVATLAAVASGSISGPKAKGPFANNARQFDKCMLRGRDVDLARFAAATRSYCEVLHSFGRFAGPSIASVQACLEKIEAAQAALLAAALTGSERRFRAARLS